MTGIEACIKIVESLSVDDPEADRMVISARKEFENYKEFSRQYNELYEQLKGNKDER